jgi:beta-glucosidase
MRKIVLLLPTLSICLPAGAQQRPVFADKSAPVETRITDLLGRMTLDEKIDALGTNPTVPRLGVVGTAHVEGLYGWAGLRTSCR